MEVTPIDFGENGDQLPDVVEAEMEELKVAIEQAIMAEILAQTDAGNTVTLVGMGEGETDVDITDGSTVSAVELESHGWVAMTITVGDVTYESVRIGWDTAVSGGDERPPVSSPAGQLIAKAGWNYFLIEGDGSERVHVLGSAVILYVSERAAPGSFRKGADETRNNSQERA